MQNLCTVVQGDLKFPTWFSHTYKIHCLNIERKIYECDTCVESMSRKLVIRWSFQNEKKSQPWVVLFSEIEVNSDFDYFYWKERNKIVIWRAILLYSDQWMFHSCGPNFSKMPTNNSLGVNVWWIAQYPSNTKVSLNFEMRLCNFLVTSIVFSMFASCSHKRKSSIKRQL